MLSGTHVITHMLSRTHAITRSVSLNYTVTRTLLQPYTVHKHPYLIHARYNAIQLLLLRQLQQPLEQQISHEAHEPLSQLSQTVPPNQLRLE